MVTIFCCLAISALHQHRGAPTGGAGVGALLSSYLLASAIGTWFLADAARYRRPQGYDLASFYFFAWWLLLPLHLIVTRRWRVWIPIACLVILCVAASIFPLLIDLLYSMLGS